MGVYDQEAYRDAEQRRFESGWSRLRSSNDDWLLGWVIAHWVAKLICLLEITFGLEKHQKVGSEAEGLVTGNDGFEPTPNNVDSRTAGVD